MESFSLAHSLGCDEVLPKHSNVIPITGEEVGPLALDALVEDRLGCARGAFYALIAELLMAIVGVLIWKLFR